MSNTIDQMRRVFEEALALAERKNADYGDAWRDQGWRGNLSRVFEKAKRLRTILWSGRSVDPQVNENVRETGIDLINSLAFFIINRDSGVEWGHETPFPLFAASLDPGRENGLVFPNSETISYIQDGIQASVNTETIPALEPAESGVLPVREPGEALEEAVVKPDRKPSPRRRMPDRQ